jgi:F-type H+-transporting ATPase subunit a|tara:strand:- start:4248 stop:4982 length:735 start_codon:yes stop_codon:yes gene_type:complete
LTEKHSPLDQFTIQRIFEMKIGNIDISLTNSSVMMIAVLVILNVFLIYATKRKSVVPGRLQSIAEMSYEMIYNTTQSNLGNNGKRLFPLVYSLFMFILLCNMLGLIPYSFTVTSHIIVTFALAFGVFLLATIMGFVINGHKYLRLFLPKGVPVFLIPILVPIEIVSYISRPISLAVRLAANMMAGHTIIKVFAMFVVTLGIWGIAPLLFIVVLYVLETLIAFLQAYVFAVLTCLYINDSFHPEH